MTATSFLGVLVLSSYRDLFTTPGAKPLAAAGLVARAPRAMIGLGIVGMLSQRTGDYVLTGAVCAAFSVSIAVFGPLVARSIDRRGQCRAARPTLAVALLGLTGLVVCSGTGVTPWADFPCVVAAGAIPNIGGMLRARWTAMYGEGPKLHTAFAVESVADEATFVIGPILALTLATAVYPEAGVICAMIFALVGTIAVTSQRRTEPEPAMRTAARGDSVLKSPGLRTLTLTFAALGCVFGGFDLTCVAFAVEHGHRAEASVALAGLAATSCLAGLVMGALRLTSRLPVRMLAVTAALALCTVPLLFVSSLLELAVVLMMLGVFVSPSIITANSLVERLVPAARLNEGLTWLLSGLSIGMSLGTLVAGCAVDRLGPQAAFVVPVGWAGCAALIVLSGLRRLGTTHQEDAGRSREPAPSGGAAAEAARSRTPVTAGRGARVRSGGLDEDESRARIGQRRNGSTAMAVNSREM
ncbi:MFS transporter [Streptomyces albireticuli]|uniref:MFS transporter n=1 Tax=Streptomyces albireticuli TaxID=1940 RepID=UPI00133149DC|nr:MFS transporter [Streptomyces albireticuli]